MSGGGNPNHDPKTGQFSDGGGEGAATGSHLGSSSDGRAQTLKDHIQGEHEKLSLAQKRAINDHVFRTTRFMNKIEGTGDQFTSASPFPEAGTAESKSQRMAVMKAAIKLDMSKYDKFVKKR